MIIKNKHKGLVSGEGGGAVLVALILVACLLVGLAAGFAARALTGERRPSSPSTTPSIDEEGRVPAGDAAPLAAPDAPSAQAFASVTLYTAPPA